MKKRSLLLCPALALALAWLVSAVADDPKPLAVTVGQQFKLTLQYNSGTGYQWVLAKPADDKLLKLVGPVEYKRPASALPGACGDMVWTFQALAEGKTGLRLNYVHPWEAGEKPAQTTNFVVVIKPPPPKNGN